MGPKLGGRPKNAIHTLYDKVTDKVEIMFEWICYPPNYFTNKFQEV
jgi:hypothetical protein